MKDKSKLKDSHETTDHTKKGLSRSILWCSILFSIAIFGWTAIRSFQQSLVRGNEVDPALVEASGGSFVTTRISGMDLESQRVREAALAADRDLLQRTRRRRLAAVQPTATSSHDDVVRKYREMRERIEDHLRQVLEEEPDSNIPKDYLDHLDEKFADGPK